MFKSLHLLLVLVLVQVLVLVPVLVSGTPTYLRTDPSTGRALQCDRCAPGSYLRAGCTATRKSECAPCPTGSFTELWNYISKCLRCGVCGHNMEESAPCTAQRDTQCACRSGYYKGSYDMCHPHSACPTGQEPLTAGTSDSDTVCRGCSNGTFSDSVSSVLRCSPHRVCGGHDPQLLLKGSSWHDNVCTNCQELRSRDAADFLREIIPSFFAHHKLTLKRLRRIVHKLPSDESNRVETSTLNASQLHARIKAWSLNATPAQIQQLPGLLAKVGASSTSQRLQNKLQRIQQNKKEICTENDDVNVIVNV